MEVAVDSITSALNAEKGGAIRIELCSALTEGGLTPSIGTFKICKSKLKIPVFPMIRCRGGDFVYNNDEMDIMCEDLLALKNNGADGFVFGILDKNNKLDEIKCKRLLEIAKPKPCTLHRAFDETENYKNALETAISLGFDRILSSGQRKNACEGADILKEIIDLANDRILIMPGAGINVLNIEEVLDKTKAKEFHGTGKEKQVIHNGHEIFVTDIGNVSKMISIYKNKKIKA